MQAKASQGALRQDNGDENGDGRVPALSLDSPWAWFYYSTFAAQVVVVTAYALLAQFALEKHDTALDIYIATLMEVSVGIPGMAAYSLLIAVTVEVTRMIAERYLAKRFRQGKQEGIAEGRAEGIAIGEARAMEQVLDMLDEDTRKEVERKLRRNGSSNGLPEDE